MADAILNVEPNELDENDCRVLKQDAKLRRAYEDRHGTGSMGSCKVR